MIENFLCVTEIISGTACWVCVSEEKYLPGMQKVLCSILTIAKTKCKQTGSGVALSGVCCGQPPN